MNLSELLNSDMTTLSRQARQGFDWWLREISALVPANLLPAGLGGAQRLTAYHRLESGDQLIVATTNGVDTLVIPRELCLVRHLTLPRMSDADLRALVEIDSDRILPLAADTVVTGMRNTGPAAQEGMVDVVIGAAPLAWARSIAAKLIDAGIEPYRIGPLHADGESLEFDLGPAMRKAGLLPARPPVARFWWTAVAVLALVNVGVAILRDSQQVSRMQELVDSQSTALGAVRRIEDRLRDNARKVEALRNKREQQQPLRTLARLGAAMPQQSWIQHLEWDGAKIRVSGYAAKDVNAVAAVKASGAFSGVRASRAEALAETVAGQPFDFSASLQEKR